MSTVAPAQAPTSGTPRVETPAPSDHREGWRHRLRPGRLIALALVVAAVAAAIPAAIRWVNHRRTHSITDDAFVEAHIVNVAPQLVSGRILRFLAEEDDRVVQGQVLAEIDPIPYRDKLNVARAQLDSALAELDRQRADLARTRKEVPIQIEIARRTSASAAADRARAEESLKLTEDDVERGIDEARAEVKAVDADLVLAVADHARVANLEGRGSATRQELDQMVRPATPPVPTSSWPVPAWPRRALRADAGRCRPPRAGVRPEVRAEGGQGDRPGGGRL